MNDKTPKRISDSFCQFIKALVKKAVTNCEPFDTQKKWQHIFSSANGHEYVDLGLPSGTLWATCNIGATTPEGYGDYFAWGETLPKSNTTIYFWITYQYCNGCFDELTKYCNNSSFGYNGFTDNLTTLLPEDDAATANWGSGWCMPTRAQWEELLENTTIKETKQNGVSGKLFTAKNGHTLFLPLSGFCDDFEDDYFYEKPWGAKLVGYSAVYWSSSLITGFPYLTSFFENDRLKSASRYVGLPVRAVRCAR